jgi:hypothetical protein
MQVTGALEDAQKAAARAAAAEFYGRPATEPCSVVELLD